MRLVIVAAVAATGVDHRHRETGPSKYTNWWRLRASFSDLLGVMWLKSRSRRPGAISEF